MKLKMLVSGLMLGLLVSAVSFGATTEPSVAITEPEITSLRAEIASLRIEVAELHKEVLEIQSPRSRPTTAPAAVQNAPIDHAFQDITTQTKECRGELHAMVEQIKRGVTYEEYRASLKKLDESFGAMTKPAAGDPFEGVYYGIKLLQKEHADALDWWTLAITESNYEPGVKIAKDGRENQWQQAISETERLEEAFSSPEAIAKYSTGAKMEWQMTKDLEAKMSHPK